MFLIAVLTVVSALSSQITTRQDFVSKLKKKQQKTIRLLYTKIAMESILYNSSKIKRIYTNICFDTNINDQLE